MEVSDDTNGKGKGEAVGDKDRGRSLLWQESPDGIVTHSLNGYFPWHASKLLFQEKYLRFNSYKCLQRSHNKPLSKRHC